MEFLVCFAVCSERGNVDGSGRAYNLSRQICLVSSKGTFVNNELTSNEHMISLLWLYVLAQSAVRGIIGTCCGGFWFTQSEVHAVHLLSASG